MNAPSGREPLLELAGVAKRFPDGTLAIGDLSLSVAAGEFVSIVGASGCGKTTALRIAAGLERATAGQVRRHTDELAYVFQEPTLMPWRTVRRNVELVAELHRMPRAQRRARAARAIEQVGLTGFAGHRPAALSGGMRMRAALAQALTLRPRLFLFDEPFSALDELTRERLGGQLHSLHAELGFGALFVTHSITEAVFLSGRVIVMSPHGGGDVTQVDVPLPYPREPSVRYSAQLAGIAARVSDALRASMSVS